MIADLKKALPLVMFLALTACGGRIYTYSETGPASLIGRAEAQTDGLVTVRASVPGMTETTDIFGAPLYDNGVQPVWLEITNSGDKPLRYAPVGTDRYYYSPLEVAWKHRGPFSEEGRLQMQKRFDRLAMPRYIGVGETVSGFVFTNLRSGLKVFNVDLFGEGASHEFTFLLDVPGFRPDYANVDFENLYSARDLAAVDVNGLRLAIESLGCCPLNAVGEPVDAPINVVLVGEGIDILKSLLRGRWRNLSESEVSQDSASYLFDRRQDATFRYDSDLNAGYYELRLWLAPVKADSNLVWAGEVRHVIQNAWSVTRRDPDSDMARGFLFQNMWYSQSLLAYAWTSGPEVLPVESIWGDLFSSSYFTDGERIVMWLSGDPVSFVEVRERSWVEFQEGQSE